MKFQQIAKEHGLHIVQFENGATVRLTDSELEDLKEQSKLPGADSSNQNPQSGPEPEKRGRRKKELGDG